MDSDRQTGRTAQQMVDAPPGAVFVWVNDQTSYPRALARHLNREDLRIESVSCFRPERLYALASLHDSFVIDHAVRLTTEAVVAIRALQARGRKVIGV